MSISTLSIKPKNKINKHKNSRFRGFFFIQAVARNGLLCYNKFVLLCPNTRIYLKTCLVTENEVNSNPVYGFLRKLTRKGFQIYSGDNYI